MKKTRFLIVLTLVVTLLLSVTACGGSKVTDGKSEAIAKETPVPIDPMGKYEPVIELDVVHGSLDPDAKFEGDETPENNVWTKAIEKDLGIKLKYRWLTDSGKSPEKMNLMIASGDLPEMSMVTRIQYDQLCEAGVLADITDAYNKYATKYLKEKVIEGDGGIALNSIKKDGKIFGLPHFLDYTESAPMIWIRTDWLKKLKLPEPKTAEEVFKIAEAFTLQDPDGNGKNDNYGIAMNRDGIGTAFWNMFHSYPPVGDHGMFKKDSSGKLVDGMFGSAEQIVATKAALLKLNEFYKKGIISKEFGAMDANKLAEEEVAGKCGIIFGGLWDPWYPLQQQKTNDTSVEWKAFPIMSVDDKPVLVGNEPYNMYSIFVMKKQTKHPEALVKLANYYSDAFVNPNFYTEKTGDPKAFEKYTALNGFKYPPITLFPKKQNYEIYLHISKAFKDKSDAELLPGEKATYQQILDYYKGKTEFWAVERSYTDESCEAVNDYYIKNNTYQFNEYVSTPTSTMIEMGPAMAKLWQETQIRVVMGDADISELDKFIEKARSLGLEKIEKEVNDWYAAKSK